MSQTRYLLRTLEITDCFEDYLKSAEEKNLWELHHLGLKYQVNYIKEFSRREEGSRRYLQASRKSRALNNDMRLIEEELNSRLRNECAAEYPSRVISYDFGSSLLGVLCQDQEAIRANAILLMRKMRDIE